MSQEWFYEYYTILIKYSYSIGLGMIKFIILSAILYFTFLAVGFIGGIEYVKLHDNNCILSSEQ